MASPLTCPIYQRHSACQPVGRINSHRTRPTLRYASPRASKGITMTTDTGSIAAAAATASGCPYRPDFNPFEDPYLSDPWSWLASAREQGPIFYSPEIDYFVVTKYADVRAVCRDPEN